MALYDYHCEADGRVQEVRHSMISHPTVMCECGQLMKRRIVPSGIVFKGNGFYKTDSRVIKTPSDVHG